LPRNYFTSLLHDGAKRKDAAHRLQELFTQMNTRDLAAPRVVPYFNGGLFTEVTTMPLGDAQLIALTKAAEANWSFVDPHIFGSVFQGIMNDAERHASGAHYTAHDDIMPVVGPTIVEPWRKRITAATSLKDAQAALDAAVADAYGIPPGQSPVEFLLELNQLVAEDEQHGRKVSSPGLPDHLDRKDSRWFSADCIEPPKAES
jgi:hypothetical protein